MHVSPTRLDLTSYQEASREVQSYFESKAPYDEKEWAAIIQLISLMMAYEARDNGVLFGESYHG